MVPLEYCNDAPGSDPPRQFRSDLAMMAYRSRAAQPVTQAELDLILKTAQSRNRRVGLTGLLIYDQGCFFQWLEGPPSALAGVWQSIRNDTRHVDVQILREQPLHKRFFGAWDMRLARRTSATLAPPFPAVEIPEALQRRLRVPRSGWTTGTWDQLFSKVVIPSVTAARRRDLPSRQPTPFIWHAHHKDGAELAGALRAQDGGAAARFVDSLVGQGAQVESLYHEVFEPAARYLGRLHDDDSVNDFDVTLVLGQLQLEARRLSAAMQRETHTAPRGHSILVATQPGEPHGLGAAMASELFWRSGWDVNCQFPADDQRLRELVSEHWYDVLDLTLSNSVRRDRQLQAVRLSIRAARAASLNPALAVIVEGRSFQECTGAYVSVGADAGFASVIDAVPVALRLLDAAAPSTSARPLESAARC